MLKTFRTFSVIALMCLAALLSAVALVPSAAYAESVEGPMGADEAAYEHVEDGADADAGVSLAAEQSDAGFDIVGLSLTIDEMLQLQWDKGSSATLSDLDPNERSLSAFADLTQPSGLTAAQLDAYIDSTSSGRSGMLHGMGYAFVQAEQTYGVNAAYLLAHAILESGWGTSTLAKGYYYDASFDVDGTVYPAGTYYNFFGIGAYDSSPISGGRSMAVKNGWSSPEAAILGGAQWIARYYIYASAYPQQTIYAMRWDYSRADATGSCWHQYATSLTWVDTLSTLMDEVYAATNTAPSYYYLFPQYSGWTIPEVAENGMYRLYNPNSGEHFYTASLQEAGGLAALGWDFEGVAWTLPEDGSPVYRLYNPYGGEHHYTTSADERESLVAAGWSYEGVGWCSDAAKGVPVYRVYNPNEFANNHHYTASVIERDALVGLGWQDEGVAWYGA